SSRDNLEKDYYKVEFGNYIVYFSTLDDINNLKDESASGLDFIEKQIILFYKDGIYQYTPISISKLLSYENEAFEGLDFREAKVEDEGFWKQVFGLINDLLAYNKSSHITRVIISLIFQGFLSIGLFSACITFFLRMSVNNRISYSKHFQMMIYIMTPFVLLSAISSLFNILLIYYVGVFITIINSFRTGQLPYGGGKNNEL
ncbi:MAG: hypothetical protein IJD46_03735, partial [Bacilli bacterium]|nr:hypothetical protein [Bacilli bacterium]